MNEYIKLFKNSKTAHGYEILSSPFLCTVKSDNDKDFVFVNKEHKCLSYDIDTKILTPINKNELEPYTLRLPDTVIKFYWSGTYALYDRYAIYDSGLFPEYNAVFESGDYTPCEYITLHVYYTDGRHETYESSFFGISWGDGSHPITEGLQIEINIPDSYIPGGWHAKSNIIKL